MRLVTRFLLRTVSIDLVSRKIMERVSTELEVTAAQAHQLEELRAHIVDSTRRQSVELLPLRKVLLSRLTDERFDPEQTGDLLRRLTDERARLVEDYTVNVIGRLHQVLTPMQRHKAVALLGDILDSTIAQYLGSSVRLLTASRPPDSAS